MSGGSYTVADMERAGRFARVLVDAALRNIWIRDYIDNPDPRFPDMWSEDRVRRHTPVRVEFEHAYGLGGLGETLAACRNKPTFGKFVGVFPVERDDPVGEFNIMYVFQESSPYNRRVLQRRHLKRRLGRGWRKLVGEAMYHPKGRFLSQIVTPDAAAIIRMALRMDPGRFWRVVRGKEWIDLPKPRRQPLLFADDDGGRVPLPLA